MSSQNFRIKILPDANLILEDTLGILNLTNAFKMIEGVFKHPEFNSTFDVIQDLTNCINHLREEDINQISGIIVSSRNKSSIRKLTLIAPTPDKTVIAMLYKKRLEESLPIIVQVVASYEAALAWMQIPLKYHEEVLSFFRY